MKNLVLRNLLFFTTIIVVLELCAYLIFEYFLTDRLSQHWKLSPNIVISNLDEDSTIDYRRQFFDPDLGWIFHKNTNAIPYATFDNLGARFDPENGIGDMIYAYGDSFTFGEDVKSNETWPHYLSELSGRHVKNFGVSGYGPDQALLRLKKHLEIGEDPDVVVLGILSENIARLVNVWRPAYTKGETLNFKPIFWKIGNSMELIPTPLKVINGNEDLFRAVEDARPYDYWLQYNLQRPPSPSWPYIWSAINTSFYLAFRVKRWDDLWRMERATEVFAYVVSEFVNLSEEYNFDPILLMIPMGKDLKLKSVDNLTTYKNTINELSKQYESKLIIIDIADEDLDPNRFFQKPFSGHTSPYGNRLIASTIKRYLKDN